MTYNIHPIIVHFPVALLTIYSLIVISRVERWFPRLNWRDAKRVLLLVGTVAAYVASTTGDMAQELVGRNPIVEKHELFASMSIWMFTILSVRELLPLVIGFLKRKNISIAFVDELNRFIQKNWIEILLAVAGFVALTITGALGGAMIYGTSADPMTAPLLKLLGL